MLPVAVSETSRLPLPQRLALTYSPARARGATLALLALDHRLGRAVAQASEPIMGQMRLAWWRDMLRQPVSARPLSDGLIPLLSCWAGEEDTLIALVDGWEEMLADPPLPASAALSLIEARAGAFAALARIVGAGGQATAAANSARVWALGDLAAGLGNPEERALALSQNNPAWAESARLPRLLRSLAILSALGRRSLMRGGGPLLDGPGASLLAMRIGMTGR